jgi:hypothetical protein
MRARARTAATDFLLRQSIFERFAGYEDVNDANRLCHDPAMRWVVGDRAITESAASASGTNLMRGRPLTASMCQARAVKCNELKEPSTMEINAGPHDSSRWRRLTKWRGSYGLCSCVEKPIVGRQQS